MYRLYCWLTQVLDRRINNEQYEGVSFEKDIAGRIGELQVLVIDFIDDRASFKDNARTLFREL